MMNNTNIKEVVMGFKSLIDSVSEQCADETIDELLTTFRTVLKDLFPAKQFVLCEDGRSDYVLIFDSEKNRDEWLLTKCPQSCSTKIIDVALLNEYSSGEWDTPNGYEETENGELSLKLW
ncbi:MAG: hypothetical protein NC299_16710 [Lachnospiraceae bacterium]|nr:hypothetical protein [Lachnospiraceae bacterium]